MTARAGDVPVDFRLLADRLELVSDATRAHVLLLLGDGQGHLDVREAETGGTRAALIRDLILLRTAGLVESRRDGLRQLYALAEAGRDLLWVVARVAAAPPAEPADRPRPGRSRCAGGDQRRLSCLSRGCRPCCASAPSSW